MNVLLLSGKFGMGHNSVANAIKEDLEKQYSKEINIRSVDICKYLFPKAHKTIYKGFGIIANKYKFIYNTSFNIVEAKDNNDILMKKRIMNNLRYLIDGFDTDLVISTLPLTSKFMSIYKEYFNSSIPVITCITDVSTHDEWLNPNTNIYFVATLSIKTHLVEQGIQEDSIYVCGVPVKSTFKDSNKIVANLNTKNKQLLIMGGGLGLLPKEENFYKNINSIKGLKTTIITGNNKHAFKKLYGKYENIDVVGYTDKVSDYMKEADLLISKPGGVTLFETIHSELPILVFKPSLSQEVFNAKYIEEEQIGKVIWDEKIDVVKEITQLLYSNLTLSQYKVNMINIKNDLEHNAPVKAINSLELYRV